MTKAYDIRIYGRVFNVGFRRYVHRYAVANDIVGFVENDYADDCVHIEAQGEETDLERFALLCGEGTPYSLITNMKVNAIPKTNHTDFQEIR